MEHTLSIIKPDAVKRNLIGEINSMIENSGIKIVAQRMMTLSLNDAENFLLNSFPSKRAMEVMGKNGKKFVNKNFSREVNSEIYRNLFYQIDKNQR